MMHLERLFVIDRLHVVGWLDGGPTFFSPSSSSFLIKHALRALLTTLWDICRSRHMCERDGSTYQLKW